MNKYILRVRLAKCVIENSDFLSIFNIERTQLTLRQVYKYGLYQHCKSSLLLIKKQKVKMTFFGVQCFWNMFQKSHQFSSNLAKVKTII